ncbi:MAG: hypothetical protein P8M72_02935 [Gammaproteobacteria bacterium]|nr:hypothetical protein [Gammaproteobacteria bacterium]
MKTSSQLLFSGITALCFCPILIAQEQADFLACADFSDRLERVICLEETLDDAVANRNSSVPEVAQIEDVQEEASAEAVSDFGRVVSDSEDVSEDASESATGRSRFRLPVIGNIFRRDSNEETQNEETVERESASGETESVSEESRFRIPVIGNIFRRNRNEPDGEIYIPGNVEPESEKVAEDRVENFGLEQNARIVVNAEGFDELFDVVTDLEMVRPNMVLITLASGQVWRQIHAKRFNLRKGDEVRIYSSAWGEDYRLVTERLNGFIQIGRVK